jgi:hypothetical protein
LTDHIQFITHRGKQILLVDLSNCSARQVEEILREAPAVVSACPLRSVLMISDFTGATFDEDGMRVMEESAVFDKPYIKKSAWVGAGSLPKGLSETMSSFSRREFPAFATREEALEWLVKD